MIPDGIDILYKVLTREGTRLYELIGERAYASNPPGNWNNGTPAVAYHIVNEERQNSGLFTGFARIRCYGGSATYLDSFKVYSAVHEALHEHTQTTSVDEDGNTHGLVMALHEDGELGLVEPDTRFYMCLNVFNIWYV